MWGGTDALTERRRKSVAVIAAVGRVLESDPPPGLDVTRFVTAYGQFETCSSPTRTWLTAEPYAYFWGRLAYELLRAILQPDSPASGLARQYCRDGSLSPREALAGHLSEFTRFSIAGAFLDGVELELDEPFETTGPLALPGTPLCLGGAGRVVIHGVCQNQLRLIGCTADSYPVVDYDGCQCRLQPAVFNVPLRGIDSEVWRAGSAFQANHAGDIERALGILRRLDADGFAQIREGLRVIALRPAGAPGALLNVSHCDLPGAVSVYNSPHPYELANIIRHELLHNRLFALEEEGWFLDEPSVEHDAGEGIYSPWRSDPRPAHGLLHAVYVFTGIGHHWVAVVRDAATPQPVCELARTRILRSLYQVRLGLSLLRRYARLTTRGHRLVSALETEHESLWQAAAAIDIGGDLPHMTFREGTLFDVEVHQDTVLQRVKSHLQCYGSAEQVEQLSPLLAG